jgi:hypothetical protein
MPIRSIEDWIAILKPLGYWGAADVILDDLDDYPKEGDLNPHRADDKRQLGNALIAWAMLTTIEIEAELGWSPTEHTPRHSDLLLKTLGKLHDNVKGAAGPGDSPDQMAERVYLAMEKQRLEMRGDQPY